MKIHTEIVYYNVPLLTGFYLLPPAFYNSYHSFEMVKKSVQSKMSQVCNLGEELTTCIIFLF
jgi:hypothetical protein